MTFKDRYFFLSTFSKSPLTVDIGGHVLNFFNVEAAFQAHKNESIANKFCYLGGLDAKRLGNQLTPQRPDWDTYQIHVMAELQHQKFKNPFLFNSLKGIEKDIVNENYWEDDFWGIYKGKGFNMLGKILTFIRDSNNDHDALIKYVDEKLIAEYLDNRK